MGIKYEDIKKAADSIKTMKIGKGDDAKEYGPVDQKVQAFRKLYPEGFIITEIVSHENGIVVMSATAGYYTESGDPVTLGVGHAYEKEGSSFINKGNYIENCETSAVGRAMSFIGLENTGSIASYEEVANAKLNQNAHKATEAQVKILSQLLSEKHIEQVREKYGVADLNELSIEDASKLISWAKEKKKEAQ